MCLSNSSQCAWQNTKWAKTYSVYWLNGKQSPVRSWQQEVFCKITASAVVFVLCGFCPITIGSGEAAQCVQTKALRSPGLLGHIPTLTLPCHKLSMYSHTDIHHTSWRLLCQELVFDSIVLPLSQPWRVEDFFRNFQQNKDLQLIWLHTNILHTLCW